MNQKETNKESERLIFSPLEYLNRSGKERERGEGSLRSHRRRKVEKNKSRKLLRKTAKIDDREPLPAAVLPKHISQHERGL